MKIIKQLSLLLLSIILILGVCGCMEQKNHEFEISNIKEIIEQRYNEEFTVEYFQPAKDETYTDILTVSNKNGLVFNAYQTNDESDITDDYPEAIINSKLKDYIVSTSGISAKFDINVLGILSDGSVLDIDYANNYTVSSANKDFIKMVVIVSLNGDIASNKNDLYKIYSELIKFDSNLIEFEVVSLSETDDELSKVISNPLGYYNNNWDELDAVENFLDIKDKNITSPEDLVKEVK